MMQRPLMPAAAAARFMARATCKGSRCMQRRILPPLPSSATAT